MNAPIAWIDEKTLEVGGIRFHLDLARERPIADERVVLMKDRALVEGYAALLRGTRVERMVELGIWGGGSAIFFERLLSPRRLVALEGFADRPAALRTHVERHDLGTVVHDHYGVWQEHATRIAAILDAEFGDDPLDLVIDDASHLLAPTRGSFNCIFPRVRPGGWFVIEDWAWAHWPGPYQTGDWLEQDPLSELVFELVMVAASRRDIVQSIRVEPGFAAVQRGPAKLGAGFDVSKSYRSRGKRLGWI